MIITSLVHRKVTLCTLVMMVIMMMNESDKQLMLIMVGDFMCCLLCIEMIKSISIVQEALFSSIIKLNK